MKIGILGGGLTGLSLGYFLQEKGIAFEILEKENECSGLCKTIQEDGFTFDCHGGHIIFSKDKEIMDFMLMLLGKNKSQHKRNAKILYKDNFVKYPFENGLNDLSKEENYECLIGFIKTLNVKDKPKNFREWILQTFGRGIAEKYLIPYNEKIWNFPTENMATFWVADRVPKPPIEDVIKSALGITTEGYTHQLYFYYPKEGGIQSLTNSIFEKISTKVTTGFEVRSIRKNDKWTVSDGSNEKIFDVLISTIPILDLVRSIDYDIQKEILDAVNGLKFNSLMTILLGFDYTSDNDKHWLYLPDTEILSHRTIFLNNYSAEAVPEGKSSIIAEITYNEGDKVSKMSDKEIIDHVLDGLQERNLANKNKICYSKVMRAKYAYVVYDLAYEQNIKTIYVYFKKIGILLCGRFSEFKYMNMDACIRSAKNTAEKIKTDKKGG